MKPLKHFFWPEMKSLILILDIFRKNDTNDSGGLCSKPFPNIKEEWEICPF